MFSFLSHLLVPALAATGRGLAGLDDSLSASLGIEGSKVEAFARRALQGAAAAEKKTAEPQSGLGL